MSRELGPPDVADRLRATWPERLGAIDWSAHETAYGCADGSERGAIADVAGLLAMLLSPSPKKRFEAAMGLDGALCHQHVMAHDALGPALPFIFEALELDDPRLVSGLVGLLRAVATCIQWLEQELGWVPAEDPWIADAYASIEAQRPVLERLAAHPDEDVREAARWAVDVIDRRAEIEMGRG